MLGGSSKADRARPGQVELDADAVRLGAGLGVGESARRATGISGGPWSRSTTGSIGSNKESIASRSSSRIVWCAAEQQRGLDDLTCLRLGTRADRVQGAVEHQGDARELLHRPVVQEESEAAAFVLLGEDQAPEHIVIGRGHG